MHFFLPADKGAIFAEFFLNIPAPRGGADEGGALELRINIGAECAKHGRRRA